MIRTLRFTGPARVSDAEPALFRARVDLTAADLGRPALLQIGGIATVAEVRVNDEPVWSTRSMWEAATVDVTPSLHAGTNEVTVRCRPLPLDEVPPRPRARWRTQLVEEHRLRWFRTSILGRAPGFAGAPPVVGPYRPVLLMTGVGPRVTSLRLRPTVRGADGHLSVRVAAEGVRDLVVELSGPDGTFSAPVVDGRCKLVVPGVTAWWPHTHGAPALHDVRVLGDGAALDLPGDGTVSREVRRVGFRTLANAAPGSLDLRVNGEPVFCRGAVWTPGDLGALDAAAALGLNLVRVSGVSAYETDAFHARCDELGLLVWQDLMFATFDYPLADDGFAAAAMAEVRAQVLRLEGHPSTVVVCGSAEHEQQAAMAGLPGAGDGGPARELAALLGPVVAEVGLEAVWVDSTPTGGRPVTRVDQGIAQYFGVGAYRRPLSDARTSGVRFAAECLAFANLPDPVVAGGVPRDLGADWDFADVRRHYAEERYGPFATTVEQQRVTGEVMADVFGEWRRPESSCAGGIVLWLRDLEPGAGWGLLDHAGRPKPAALALAPVLAPTAVWIVDEGLSGLDVHVAHDPGEPVDLTLRVALVRADGSVLEEAETAWTMPAHGHRVFGVEELLGRFADAAYVYRFGPPAHAGVRAVLSGPEIHRTARWSVPGTAYSRTSAASSHSSSAASFSS